MRAYLLHNVVSTYILPHAINKVMYSVYLHIPDVQAGFRKGRGTRDQIANIHWIMKKKQESSRKTSISALLITPKPLTEWITTNCGKF